MNLGRRCGRLYGRERLDNLSTSVRLSVGLPFEPAEHVADQEGPLPLP